jgi:hypothetical protein
MAEFTQSIIKSGMAIFAGAGWAGIFYLLIIAAAGLPAAVSVALVAAMVSAPLAFAVVFTVFPAEYTVIVIL